MASISWLKGYKDIYLQIIVSKIYVLCIQLFNILQLISVNNAFILPTLETSHTYPSIPLTFRMTIICFIMVSLKIYPILDLKFLIFQLGTDMGNEKCCQKSLDIDCKSHTVQKIIQKHPIVDWVTAWEGFSS